MGVRLEREAVSVSQKHAPRRRSREVALQTLYAADVAAHGGRTSAPCAEDVFEGIAENFDLPEGARAFAKQLACGTVEARGPIDELVEKHAVNWRVSRMATVDRNILRLAVYELLYTETPVSVVLDEAIELAHRFGSDASPPFVNGVLDAVATATLGRRGEGVSS